MALFNYAKTFFRNHRFIASCGTYGILYVGAELSQQTVTKKFLTSPPQDIDKPTLARYGVMGTLIYSPILYNWYKWLDKTFPGTARKTILKKLFFDQFFLTPPLLVIFYTGMSLMEMKFDDPFEECRKKFIATFQRSCLFWLPAQTVNFILIPPAFRVIYMGFASFCWVNILCFLKRQKMDEFEVTN